MNWPLICLAVYNSAYVVGYVMGASAPQPNPWWVMFGAALFSTGICATVHLTTRTTDRSSDSEGGAS